MCICMNASKLYYVFSHDQLYLLLQRKTTGGCPICKQLIALCCYHAKICKESKCSVPFCANIKSKVKMQKASQRLQQDRLLQRRVAQQRGGSAMASVATPVRAVGQQLSAQTG